MTERRTDGVPTMPFEQEHPLQPAPVLRALQEEGPIHKVRTVTGDEAWLVTGYEQVKALYAGDRLARAHPRPSRAPRLTASALFGGRPRENYLSEDADRTWFREVLHTIVSPAKLREFRPWVDELVTRLLGDLEAAGPPADFVDLVAVPLPTLVICKLLGVPEKDLARCRKLTEAIASARDERRSNAGLMALVAHLRGLAGTGKAEPGGLLMRLREAPFSVDDTVIGHIGASLMFTGHHTTVVAIGYMALHLMNNPDQREAVASDPDKLTAAVEEALRIGNVGVNTGGGNGIPTYARSSLDCAGTRIGAGDLVLLDTGAANHDATVYTDPYRYDIERTDAAHLTFGHGRHYCPGAPLARMEMQALFAQWIPRFPTMRLAVEVRELHSHSDQITGGLTALPVTW